VKKTVFKYRNKIGKIVVKTVPYSVNVNVKNTFTSHIDKKNIFDIFLDFFIFIHFHYMKITKMDKKNKKKKKPKSAK
jgi:hypothetical protein